MRNIKPSLCRHPISAGWRWIYVLMHQCQGRYSCIFHQTESLSLICSCSIKDLSVIHFIDHRKDAKLITQSFRVDTRAALMWLGAPFCLWGRRLDNTVLFKEIGSNCAFSYNTRRYRYRIHRVSGIRYQAFPACPELDNNAKSRVVGWRVVSALFPCRELICFETKASFYRRMLGVSKNDPFNEEDFLHF